MHRSGEATDKAKDHGYSGSSCRRVHIVLQIGRAWDVVMPERILISAELEVGVGRHSNRKSICKRLERE